ncbi:hypothetical protein BX667DRAFT_526923 [Coemansia mojavensis]|nr:hypothetical protein BX667DRAFT_526923 [Coemansia mojavensis]
MANFTDIPYEIIRLILYRIAGDDRCINYNLWREYAPYLSICRLIRNVAIPIFYSRLEVEIPYTDGELAIISTNGRNNIAISIINSNINLVMQNGFEDLVTHMDIQGSGLSSHRLVWFFWAMHLIPDSEDASADGMVKLLQNEIQKALPEGDKISKWLAPEKYVIMLLQQKFPNIKSISFKSSDELKGDKGMIYNMVQEYANKLVQFTWAAPIPNFYNITLLRLEKLRIDCFRDLDSNESPVIVDPQLLKKLYIRFFRGFAWEMFKLKPWPICFPALEELNLNSACVDFAMGSLCEERLIFPALTKLTIIGVDISAESVACLMQSKALRFLHYGGDINTALKLCQHTSSLDTFEFILAKSSQSRITDITGLTNRLFDITQNIRHVKLYLKINSPKLDYPAIRWQFLTHLSIFGNREELRMLESFANMNMLKTVFFYLLCPKVDKVYSYLLDLATKEPSNCGIQKLSLIYMVYDGNKNLFKEKNKVVNSLQHYFPKAETIFVGGSE